MLNSPIRLIQDTSTQEFIFLPRDDYFWNLKNRLDDANHYTLHRQLQCNREILRLMGNVNSKFFCYHVIIEPYYLSAQSSVILLDNAKTAARG